MQKQQVKAKRYAQRKRRVRSRITGTEVRPRLTVFRSNAHIYAQIINDEKGVTLASFSDKLIKKAEKMNKVAVAAVVGEELAKLATALKVKAVVFDRNGFIYHGRVKALADGARKGGLQF